MQCAVGAISVVVFTDLVIVVVFIDLYLLVRAGWLFLLTGASISSEVVSSYFYK